MEADSKGALAASLIGQGYYILELQEIQETGMNRELKLPALERVSARDLTAFTRQLATMIEAGIPLIRCFSILGQQTENRALKAATLDVKNDLENGLPLSEAMAKHPKIFSRLYVSMVRAGEMGGFLSEVLARLCDHLEREAEINAKVRSASIYPTILTVFALVVVFFIITFIMPTFTSMFTQAGASLPAPTRVMLAIGTFLKTRLWLVIALVLAAVLAVRGFKRTEAGSLFFDRLALRLPVIGKANSRITAARFARTMGTLVRTGIPVLKALEAVEEVVDNRVVAEAIRRARTSIREGESIAGPLAKTAVFEPMVIQMIAVGEETGTLDEMLGRLSDYFDKEVMYMVEALMAVIEPLLILFVAVIIGGIVISTLLPVFEMVNVVGGGM